MDEKASPRRRRRSDNQPGLKYKADTQSAGMVVVVEDAVLPTPVRVMVVDDEPMNVMVVSEILEQNGYQVLTAASAEQCLADSRPQEIDVLITDVVMPGKSGFDLLSEFKAMDRSLSIIVMTGEDGYDMVRRALSLGAYDYLPKPLINFEELLVHVRRAAAATALERQNTSLLTSLAEMNQKLSMLNDRLHALATTDELTGLYNRRHVDLQLDTQVEIHAAQGFPLSVILLDIDHFKSVNDNYSHEAGDRLLQQVGQILSRGLRRSDIAGRYGGEEFVVILPDTVPSEGVVLAERLRQALRSCEIDLGVEKLNITASFGVSGFEAGKVASSRELIRGADSAMYVAKEGGRDRVAVQKPGRPPCAAVA